MDSLSLQLKSPHLQCPSGRPGLRGPPALAPKLSLLPACAPPLAPAAPAAAASASAAAAAGAAAVIVPLPPPVVIHATRRVSSGAAAAVGTAPPAAARATATIAPPVCRARRPRGPCLSSGLSLDAAELLASVQDLEGLGSHVELPRLLPGAALHGNWAVAGPAVVRRVGHSLRALVRRGGWVALGAALDTVVPAEDAAPQPPHALGAWLDGGGDGGDGAGGAPLATSFELHGTLVELSGPFKMLSPGPGAREHAGRLILTIPQLDEGNCILLLPGGCLSHPLCAMPRGVPPMGQRLAPRAAAAHAALS